LARIDVEAFDQHLGFGIALGIELQMRMAVSTQESPLAISTS
jgi:hypothetical protein